MIYLNQGWSQNDREWYYNFSQGSAILSYDIFLNLEIANDQELFRSDANSVRYGLIPGAPNWINPDGLPIGMSKTTLATAIGDWPAGDYAGPTCAACHETQLNYKGKRVRIDGGAGNTFDIQAYIQALDAAIGETLTDAAKFDRLATRLGVAGPEAKAKLRERFERQASAIHQYATISSASPSHWGPARIDARSLINNRLTAILPGIPENTSTAIAPVKPPFLWNSPQGLWTQWAAYIQSPLDRNLGETMGVFMPINLHAKTPAEGLYDSNAAIPELQRVEKQLERLAPPSWPEDVFGKIDREKAKTGKALFMEHCASCHNAWPYRWSEPNKYGKRFVLVGLVPQSYMGTDRAQSEAIRPFAVTGQFSNSLPPQFRGKYVVPMYDLARTIRIAVEEKAVAKLNPSPAELVELNGYRELPQPPIPDQVWKAAPRDGVWATPPFLHNGSVPNLYEMLVPAGERSKKFCITREFDPIKVGFDTTCGPNTFVLDTSLLGNTNAGHSFQDGPRGNGVVGPLLSDDQRWALVEYLKSIPEEPGRITPYGGPPETSQPQKP
ncbi:di-heme-cytochrome C peroxidase [Bradyrhizobium sp. CCGB01]|uniref:di-heme-cytochrome C peroxidase n=1 Tax=Bradyrhizobium sp. CCGB01 TaxID=2949634 RepID=UPI0020B313CB|nr:di-heme-cytochrome C peroxidase [Bradyrhizobium sp. CCGB01]MCP3408128.1 di-heme-cytochrome C peroxidase [Bradyrhizobium sp. CCGB01]